METIWILDPARVQSIRLSPALEKAGWAVQTADNVSDISEDAAAVIVVASVENVQRIRRRSGLKGAPIIILASLDRSGWDRTFHDETALEADALLDLDAAPKAVVKRLQGILEARQRSSSVSAAGFEDIVRRAVDNEIAAENFYRKVAAVSRNATTRGILETLAREEAEHKRFLEEFLEGKRAFPTRPVSPTYIMEKFGTPEFSPDMSPADAFLLAARKEKLAIEFYESWAELYPEGPERNLLEGLADIERGHKNHVEELFVNASFPEDYFEG